MVPKKQKEFWQHLESRGNSNKSLKSGLKRRRTHGGGAARGKRKEYRPLSTRDPIHLVLRSSKAKGKLSFLHRENPKLVRSIINKQARKFFVKINGYANVGNHLHLEVAIAGRKEFQKFLKSITCLIARKITGARRGHKFGKFWDDLAFTRVLKTKFEKLILSRYIVANKIEAVSGPFARARFLDRRLGHPFVNDH